MEHFQIKYTGTALPGNAEVVTLIDTVVAGWGANAIATLGIARFYVAIANSQAGTLKAYKSVDRGANWIQIVADQAVAIVATNSENINDYLVEAYQDFKLTWTNGASVQTVFSVSMSANGQRAKGN